MKKLVVITGASSGIGKEMAITFSKAGYPTLLLARRIEMLNNIVKENQLSNVMCEQVDVTNYEAFNNAIKKAEEKFGKTDLLINNAGVMLLGQIEDQNPNEWQRMLDINVKGVLNGMQIVLSDMKNRNSGTIINISSIAGRKTFPNHAAYVATKFGVHALTETVREEVSSHNVRVLIIAPGAVETELLSHTTNQDYIDGYQEWKQTMGGKVINPTPVAKSALFMYEMPQEVSIRELLIATTKQNA